jgi:hypothetical protein
MLETGKIGFQVLSSQVGHLSRLGQFAESGTRLGYGDVVDDGSFPSG